MGAEGIFSRLKCLQYVALGNESIPHVWALVPNKQFIIGLLQRGFSMILMPFTGPKMFWAGPNSLCQTKYLSTYCGSHKRFVPDKEMICIQ